LTPTRGLHYDVGMPTAAETLSTVPLFANLSARQLRKLAKSTHQDRYEAGDVIVNEGGTTQTMFVIVEGSAKVVRNGRTISRRDPGDFFGEISMIDGRPRSASVVAETQMSCLVLYHDELRKLLLSDAQLAWDLLRTLAARIREA